MKKLKTLKDFENDCPCCVGRDDLKQEAIKWYHRSDDNKHKFIREFLNIIEEELKPSHKKRYQNLSKEKS